MLDYHQGVEYRIDDVPDAVRTYPASAGVVMVPLTPANKWTATIMYGGGANIWVKSVRVPLPGGISSSPFCKCADGRQTGTLPSMRSQFWFDSLSYFLAPQLSYADHPILLPVVHNSLAPAGSQWTRDGFYASTIPRMCRSTATLLVSLALKSRYPSPFKFLPLCPVSFHRLRPHLAFV